MQFLITGGCGFLGSNLAAEVLSRGHELTIVDNLYRKGSADNLNWLKQKGKFNYANLDTRNSTEIEKLFKNLKPDIVFHLAGQVAMTTSLSNPREDFEINVVGGFNILEAVRKFSPEAVVTYSSTNKVYGDLEQIHYFETDTRYIAKGFEKGFDESLPLHFESPYGCSKGTIDQYMLDYARMYGLKTVVFRHSSIFGGRQFATVDQGWVGWFCKQAFSIKHNRLLKPFTISGNGKQVRDILFASDLINCYFSAIENINLTKGKAYNIGGGVSNSLSLLELFNFLEKELDIKMQYSKLPARKSDQKVFIANGEKAFNDFNWKPLVSKDESVRLMLNWVSQID